ncbi:MAG TPA: bifunctional 4-hydroxy-2-oxoglutarate aldolase/2-dehydro-3-deoxy-phosphogluconate aldolase [Verrucomicrobiae bacterium]|nr:bifunctional 4-hydroxy-2-oxoglutarate aldolase/2-dehydro-3-deoxy-phosphogluconate aldolase [Verrucomicrobiae bacterium]
MSKDAVLRGLRECGVLPVVRAPSADEAVALGEAIVAGGLPVLEITLTVPDALAAIERLAAKLGDSVLIGAGSVLDAAGVRASVEAGARFIVTPAFDAEALQACRDLSVACIVGALTPTEILLASRAGADWVKVFPCDAVGGARYLRSLKGPLPNIPLVPTGGVTLDTLGDYFNAGAVAVGVGSDLADLAALRSGDAARISGKARAYARARAAARRPG